MGLRLLSWMGPAASVALNGTLPDPGDSALTH